MNRVRVLVSAVVAVGLMATPSVAAAAPTLLPFQVNPAPLGNPNGSFDAPAIRCAVEVGRQAGVVTITGGERDRWGCLISGDVRWLNLSTGTHGMARMSPGLHGHPPEATVRTGSGRVTIVMLQAVPGNVTPGLTTFSVP